MFKGEELTKLKDGFIRKAQIVAQRSYKQIPWLLASFCRRIFNSREMDYVFLVSLLLFGTENSTYIITSVWGLH